MIATLDERHIARGYDPYNSADQPHVITSVNKKFARNTLPLAHPAQALSDGEIDAKTTRGLRHLLEHGYEFFPGQRRKFP